MSGRRLALGIFVGSLSAALTSSLLHILGELHIHEEDPREHGPLEEELRKLHIPPTEP